MIYGSVCSGIEAASVAWEPLGWGPTWFAEIDKFPSAALAHHWPDTMDLGDMTTIKGLMELGVLTPPDILVGGTPCQSFSVAGSRESLDDDRGKLTLEFVRLANTIDKNRENNESIIVWENVPGVLNTKDNAFGCFLGELSGAGCELQPAGKRWGNAGCVFGPQRAIAWRILDAQYFGVAQRRRRVFVVASARAGFDPTKILFESEGMRRDSPPSRETGSGVAALTANGVGTCGADDNQAQAGHLIVHGTQDPCVSKNLAFALGRNSGAENAVYPIQNATRGASQNGLGVGADGAPCYTLDVGSQHGINRGSHVRRLTPVECERLQGFPDGHTDIPYRGKPACDGPRYKAIGNSMAVPVIHWLGKRIEEYMKC